MRIPVDSLLVAFAYLDHLSELIAVRKYDKLSVSGIFHARRIGQGY